MEGVQQEWQGRFCLLSTVRACWGLCRYLLERVLCLLSPYGFLLSSAPAC